MKKLILILLFFSSLGIVKAQEPLADSLAGIYVGLYYFKYAEDTSWTISTDSTYVTSINENDCSLSLYGSVGNFNYSQFQTTYSYCNGTSSNLFTRFYSQDSLFIKYYNISQPPPNVHLYSFMFKGKRIPNTSTIGINEADPNTKIDIFPNPATSVLTVNLPYNNNSTKVKIFDLLGHLVLSDQFNTKSFTIELNKFKTGLYILQWENGSNSGLEKIMVNK